MSSSCDFDNTSIEYEAMAKAAELTSGQVILCAEMFCTFGVVSFFILIVRDSFLFAL